jgi:NitT/TauT family transport system substrate-binding protein
MVRPRRLFPSLPLLATFVSTLLLASCGGASPAASASPPPATGSASGGAAAKPSASVSAPAAASAKPAVASGAAASAKPGAPASGAAASAKPGVPASGTTGSTRPAAGAYTPGPVLNPPVPVRIGFIASLTESPEVIADKRGYFAAEGLTAQYLANFTNSGDALLALGSNQIDVFTGGLSPGVFNSIARGIKVEILATGGGQAQGRDTLGLTVRKDLIDSGRYKTPADLKGMKIGDSSPYNVIHYMLYLALKQNGLTLSDIDLVTTGGLPNSVAALANKGVDAIVTVEPFVSDPEAKGFGKVVFRSHDIDPNIPGGVFMMAPDFRAKHPEAAQRYLVAWLRGVRDYLDAFVKGTDKDATIKLLQDNKIAYNASVQIPDFDPNGRFDVKGMQGLLDWYVQEKQVQNPPDLNTLVNFQFVDEAARKLGPYQK